MPTAGRFIIGAIIGLAGRVDELISVLPDGISCQSPPQHPHGVSSGGFRGSFWVHRDHDELQRGPVALTRTDKDGGDDVLNKREKINDYLVSKPHFAE